MFADGKFAKFTHSNRLGTYAECHRVQFQTSLSWTLNYGFFSSEIPADRLRVTLFTEGPGGSSYFDDVYISSLNPEGI